MTNFELLLICTAALRGIGAGAIFGVTIMTLPVRKRLGLTAYSEFMKAHYKEHGVKIYAGITILGLAFTVWLSVIAYENNIPNNVLCFITGSLLVTIVGFVGTAGAFPVMNKLWKATTLSNTETAQLLDKFAFRSLISAAAHIIAFILLIIAISNH
jgi:hypothetical protein